MSAGNLQTMTEDSILGQIRTKEKWLGSIRVGGEERRKTQESGLGCERSPSSA